MLLPSRPVRGMLGDEPLGRLGAHRTLQLLHNLMPEELVAATAAARAAPPRAVDGDASVAPPLPDPHGDTDPAASAAATAAVLLLVAAGAGGGPGPLEQELRRVSSCYFSVRSEASADASRDDGESDTEYGLSDRFASAVDLRSLWRMEDEDENDVGAALVGMDVMWEEEDTLKMTASASPLAGIGAARSPPRTENAVTGGGAADWLHRDELVRRVLEYCDVAALGGFSETCCRANAVCRDHLRHRLERAAAAGAAARRGEDRCRRRPDETAVLRRLARMDPAQAQDIVREYVATSRTPPIRTAATVALALALRLRQLLRPEPVAAESPESRRHRLAGGLLLLTVLGGAAAAAAASADASGAEAAAALAAALEQSDLPQVLMKLGLVGSLLRAAKTVHDSQSAGAAPTADGPNDSAGGSAPSVVSQEAADQRQLLSDRSPLFRRLQAVLHQTSVEPAAAEDAAEIQETSAQGSREVRVTGASEAPSPVTLNRPVRSSGCVGAYLRGLSHANRLVRSRIKAERQERFERLSATEQVQLARAFLHACRSDDGLVAVKDLIHSLDANGVYVGIDDTETCALHVAAFFGAPKVLEFLCSGIAEDSRLCDDPCDHEPIDGGLCNVNQQDRNGWTAAHFCAANNSVSTLTVLAKFGADLDVEAANGYTPLQWAMRLKKERIARELRQRTGREDGRWTISGQPLSAIASRFLAMIPTHNS